MKRLTQSQINHLTYRANQLFREITDKQVAKLGERPKAVDYTNEQKMQLITKGKASFRKGFDPDRYNHGNALDCFIYPQTPQMRRAAEKIRLYDLQVEIIRDRVKAEEQRFIDNAILGDSEEALIALRNLEKRNIG